MTNLIRRPGSEQPVPWSSPHFEIDKFDQSETQEIQRLVSRLLKRKYQILAVFLMVLIPAAVITLLMVPLYRSAALIQVNPDRVQVLPYRDVTDQAIGGSNYENYMGTQEQLLKGQGLIARVAHRLDSDFKTDPAFAEKSLLGDRFEVKKIEKSQLFEISYQAPSPEVAARVVNLFAEEYIKQNFEVRQATQQKAEQDLKKELQALEQKTQFSEKELVSYAEKHNIMSLEQGQVDPVQQKLATLTQQVAEAEAALAVAKSQFETTQKASTANFPERMVTPQIGQLDSKLFQLEQDLTTLRGSFGESWPDVVKKRSEIALVREQLNREKAAVLARSREQAQLDLRSAEGRQSRLLASLNEQTGLVNQFHNASIQYNILKREVDTNRNLYDGMLERLKQNGVMAGFQFGNLQIVEPGRPQRKVFSPDLLTNLGLAALVGLALGLCIAILMDFWNNSISTLEEAEQLSPLPSLGRVPLIKASALLRALPSPGSRLASTKADGTRLLKSDSKVSRKEPSYPWELAESVRTICASILLSKSEQRPKVIVVTSSTPNEGKTTLVSQLGRAFAEAGSKTLLIEGDLRKPDLSDIFAVTHENGLSPFLAGHVSPSPKIHDTSIPNLHIVAAGPTPPNPVALLNSDKLSLFLNAASSNYQFVIVDAPPVLAVADARILGIKADGVVLVVRAGRTPKHLIRRSWAILENSGSNVLGMVLNGAEPDRAEATYYSYYQPRARA